MAYASRSRFTKRAASPYRRSRFGSGSATKVAYRKKTTRYTKRITRKLNRKEIKYDDDYYKLNAWQQYNQSSTGNAAAFVNYVLGGVVTSSTFDIGTAENSMDSTARIEIKGKDEKMMPNCLTNIDNGTTANTRIGNMVQPRYITLKCVMNAAMTNNIDDPETLGKLEENASGTKVAIGRFCRTSVKLFIIRDKSMNEKGYVSFNDVFDAPMGSSSEAGNNPFLWNRKIDTINRYQILKQQEFQLDADDPQKSFTWIVPLKGVPIRFNGSANATSSWKYYGTTMSVGEVDITPNLDKVNAFVSKKSSSEAQSMTNGIYMLAVAHVGTKVGGDGNMLSPAITFSSRLTFEDS